MLLFLKRCFSYFQQKDTLRYLVRNRKLLELIEMNCLPPFIARHLL